MIRFKYPAFLMSEPLAIWDEIEQIKKAIPWIKNNERAARLFDMLEDSAAEVQIKADQLEEMAYKYKAMLIILGYPDHAETAENLSPERLRMIINRLDNER